MGLQCCLGGTTMKTLRLATTISSSSSSSSSTNSIFRPSSSKTLTLHLLLTRRHHHSFNQTASLPFLVRALSSSAVQTTPIPKIEESVVKPPQWKAAIDFKWIRENKDAVAVNIKNRKSNADLVLVLDLYDKVLNLQKEVERLRGERNVVANKMKGKLEQSERQKLIEEGKNLKEALTGLEEDLVKLTDELQQEAQCIPNVTHQDVPMGGEDCSTVRKMVGSPREFSFAVKDHPQLGKDLDLFDFDAAAEVFFLFYLSQRERRKERRTILTKGRIDAARRLKKSSNNKKLGSIQRQLRRTSFERDINEIEDFKTMKPRIDDTHFC